MVTTFVLQTATTLQPDQALIMNHMLAEQNALLRAAGNATAIRSIPPVLLALILERTPIQMSGSILFSLQACRFLWRPLYAQY